MTSARNRTRRSLRRATGVGFLFGYRFWRRAVAKSFSLLASGGFAQFGRRTVLEPPIRLSGEGSMRIGDDVYVGAGSWLQVLDGSEATVALEIGDGTNIVGACVISAARSVRVGRHVLMARNVYIADHMHGFEDQALPVIKQGIDRVRAVEICDGAWLGENVVIGPGVRIGVGAVVGANAVVLSDVPDYAVAAGVPARLIRSAGGHRGLRPDAPRR
jgi:acetyltransferase-like isoleucine patch superfamily enzyme